MTFFPSKRSIGTCASAATIIPSASSISFEVSTFFAPPEPLVSTFTAQSFAFAAFSIPSAAIYVCAIPVGQDVTARIFTFPLVSSSAAVPSPASLSSIPASFSSASLMIPINSSTVSAFLKASVNSSFIRRTDNLLNTSRWILSSVFGAAIRNISVTGSPSSESKSTPSLTTIAASPGFVTASHFPCGMAIPSPIPVVLSSSLAYTCFLYASLSLIFSLFTMRSMIWSSASFLLFGDAFKRILLASSKSVILI